MAPQRNKPRSWAPRGSGVAARESVWKSNDSVAFTVTLSPDIMVCVAFTNQTSLVRSCDRHDITQWCERPL